ISQNYALWSAAARYAVPAPVVRDGLTAEDRSHPWLEVSVSVYAFVPDSKVAVLRGVRGRNLPGLVERFKVEIGIIVGSGPGDKIQEVGTPVHRGWHSKA